MLALALFSTWTLAAPARLEPGFWVGEVPAGRVWLVLRGAGPATLGGVDYPTWRIDGETLHLGGPQPLDLQIESGRCLVGRPFGRVCLAPVAMAEPPPRPPRQHPPAWVGRWWHEASGGRLVLELTAAGRYRMIQAVVGDPQAETTGTWHHDERGLVLEPTGGPPLPYQARRVGPDLFIGGGDLPFEVRFAPQSP